MKKAILPISVLLLFSCSTPSDPFCDCLEAGEKLNNFSEKLMEGSATEDEATELKQLRDAKKSACEEYETMDGATMREKKAACEEN